MSSIYYRFFQNLGLVVISLGLLFGGVAILRTGIPFWSLLYGLPAVFLGMILTVLSFNEITKNTVYKLDTYHQIPCKVCKKMTLVPELIESAVCPDCQYKTAVRLQIGALIFLVAVALPVSLHLVKQAQLIKQNAQVQPSPICADGAWEPSECKCGNWNREVCETGEQRRVCGGLDYCCKLNENTWKCKLNKP